MLVNEVGARFAEGEGPQAVRFEARRYRMLDGAAHLRFVHGADVVVKAPASFTIHDELRLTLEEGSLRALVPESAEGFTVNGPGVRFLDLGTEFGVAVDRVSGRSELHVFEGEVEVFPDGSHKPVATVTSGESVSVVRGELRPASRPAPESFPTAESLALRRWEGWRQTFRQDPDLLLY